MNLVSKLGVAALATALTTGLTVPAATAGDAPVERSVAHKKAAYKPTLKASTSTVEATKKLVLSGKVKPSTKGGKVVLQKRIGTSKKWSTEAELKTSKKGTFTYTDKPKRVGVRHYRVVVPKSKNVKAGKSKAVKVTVASWRSLADIRFRAAESTVVAWRGTSIDGNEYAPSIVAAPEAVQGKADWNIPASCTTLRVRLGNGDQTDLGARAKVSLDGGPGEFAYTHSYAPTQSELKTFNVKGVFRLTFSWTSTVGTNPEPAAGAQPVLAKPELLCS
jgi:hypothetical protein